ncbi:MAG: glycoside hydrolase family 28 protein [Undibacterium sp.]|nr:glycoside hydrolase family 28 protein [Opitutaceae bacterium]
MLLAFVHLDSAAAATTAPTVSWSTADEILTRIKAPAFPAKNFLITDFGAVAGGTQDATAAIAKAIAACHAAGGGRVVVPAGVFLTGAVHLKSNVNLHVVAGATLRFSFDRALYPLVYTRWEGVECMNYSPLIYAFEQENIAVTGGGTLDGGATADTWWSWNIKRAAQPAKQRLDRDALNAMGDAGAPVSARVFGPGHFLRPNFIQPYRCKNVLIEGVTINRSPMWEVHPVLSTNVTVRGLTIVSHGPNNDGCDPESCRDVLIENCSFETGDDCIAIKSGRNADGRRVNVPAENIIVRNCTMKDGHGGVVIGSEIAGDCRNVFVENCVMDSPNLDRALRFKSNAVRGGVIENVFMRNVQIGRVSEAVLTIDFLYEEGAKGPFMPTARHIVMENVTSKSSPRVFYVVGFKGAVIDDIRIANSIFSGVNATDVMHHAGRVVLENVTVEPAKVTRSLNSNAAPSP